MSETDDAIRIAVTPEPTPEEMAAISAVVAGLAASGAPGHGDEREPSGGGRERWALAGRREVLRPMDRDWASQKML